jgi:hypothetical protein
MRAVECMDELLSGVGVGSFRQFGHTRARGNGHLDGLALLGGAGSFLAQADGAAPAALESRGALGRAAARCVFDRPESSGTAD